MLRFRPPEKTNVIDIYEDHAASWWNFDNPIFAPLHAMLPARAAYLDRHGIDVAGKVVVDVGAGGGYVAGILAERGARVVAIDVARAALAAGRKHHEARHDQALSDRLAWTEASALRLPIADNSADVVVATDVLVHLPLEHGGARAGIAEVARVLKPGGSFWFSTVSNSWLARFVMITLGEDLLRFVHKGTHEPSTFINPAQMRAICADVGLTLQVGEGVGPVGLGRDNGRWALRMGRLPSSAVMWQGHATKPA